MNRSESLVNLINWCDLRSGVLMCEFIRSHNKSEASVGVAGFNVRSISLILFHMSCEVSAVFAADHLSEDCCKLEV